MNELVCRSCSKRFSSNENSWRCQCGGLLDLDFRAAFPRALIGRRAPGMWRYREALPINDDDSIVSFDEGFTPLLPVSVDGHTVLLKQDHLFPTGSFKDRGASVLMSKVKELGIDHVVEDSSGNAGCSVAAYGAKAGISCDIYVPVATAAAKLAQIAWYGARLIKVPGSREDTAAAVFEAAQQHYYASHSWNPYFFQGTKTVAFEICEQLGWRAPEAFIVPAGNGTLVIGAFLGFQELLQAGIINRLPRIICIQAANCAPLSRALEQQGDTPPTISPSPTLAEGIAIVAPIRGEQMLSAIRETRGAVLAVTETEIIQALKLMCRQGYYLEPTAAATIAGLRTFLRGATLTGPIVSIITGSGLKNTEKMLHLLAAV